MLAERLPSELDHTNSEGADISKSTTRELLQILQPQEKPRISLDSKDSKHRLQSHWKPDFHGSYYSELFDVSTLCLHVQSSGNLQSK